MHRVVLLSVVALLFLAAIPSPAEGQYGCVMCDNDDCVGHIQGSACYCIVRIRQNGVKICREEGLCDSSHNPPCIWERPEFESYRITTGPKSISSIDLRDEVLGILFEGSTIVDDRTLGWALNDRDYGRGTLTTKDGLRFVHHGSFEWRTSDSLVIRFVVHPDPNDGSGIEYSGTLDFSSEGPAVLRVRKSEFLPTGDRSEAESPAIVIELPDTRLRAEPERFR